MRARIDVDPDRCLATGACVHALPELFEIGADGVAHVIGTVDGAGEIVAQVVAECPTAALRLVRAADAQRPERGDSDG